MIQDRVLKIMKGLNTFSQDDIIIMADVDESEADKILAELIKEEKIISINKNKFKYQPTQKCLTLKLVEKQKIQLVKENNITFRQAAEYFLTNHASINCTPATYEYYRSIIRFHLLQFFKNRKLTEIQTKDIKEFIELKYKEKMTTKRINGCVTLLGSMFKKYIEWNFIAESPYNGIINVKFQKTQKIQIFNVAETQILLETSRIKYPEIYYLLLIMLSTGLKRTEVLALKKEDFDFKNFKIYINKTFFEGKILIPKTKSIIRQVGIPENIALEINTILKSNKDEDFVFYNSKLSPLTIDKRIRKSFLALLGELNLPKITFNELRHTYAYNSLQEGMSIDYLHKQLGDYSIQATMDKYRNFIKT